MPQVNEVSWLLISLYLTAVCLINMLTLNFLVVNKLSKKIKLDLFIFYIL